MERPVREMESGNPSLVYEASKKAAAAGRGDSCKDLTKRLARSTEVGGGREGTRNKVAILATLRWLQQTADWYSLRRDRARGE